MLREELFKNTIQHAERVEIGRIKSFLMAGSAVFHLLVLVISSVLISVKGPPIRASESVNASLVPVYFENLKPPPPPLPPKTKSKLLKQLDKSTLKPIEKAVVVPTPIEPLKEIKPEPPSETTKDIVDENNDVSEVAGGVEGGVPGGVPGGKQGGVVGGVPGGTVGQPPSTGVSISKLPIVIKGEVKPPIRIKYVHPTYPSDAIKVRIEGTVIVEAVIGKDGKIKSAVIIQSVPFLGLVALEAVKKWEYTPMIIDSEPREAILTVTIKFKLM